MTPAAAVTVRRLGAADAEAYRAIRLESLAAHPEAFAASHDEEAGQPPAWFAERLARAAVFGAEAEAGVGPLLGVAGLWFAAEAKRAHKAHLWGMYVRPSARGAGAGRALLAAALAHARGRGAEGVQLGVAVGNAPALRLYEAVGFRAYGRERAALRVGDRDLDEWLMEAQPKRQPLS